MIRNIFIIDNDGNSLVAVNFGECHSLSENSRVVSGFISAIHNFSRNLSGEGANEIRLGDLFFLIRNHNDFLFVLTADTDNRDENTRKLQTIRSLFIERYAEYLTDNIDSIDSTVFDDFGSLLISSGIAEYNCGDNPTCEECENRHKMLPLDEMTDQIS